MYIPKEERETIITYNEAEPTASVYTMNGGAHPQAGRPGPEPPGRCPAGQNLPGRGAGIRGTQEVGEGERGAGVDG